MISQFPLALLFLFVGVAVGQVPSSTYNLVLHSKERGAACLDGSPAGMYVNEGVGANKTKFLIFFNGGGFCGGLTLAETIQSCYKRSKTDLGTTTVYSQQITKQFAGILSSRKDVNPHFYDWTKAIIIYCDGASHQGYRQSPIEYKGQNLYFRGSRNSLEHFYYLQKTYNLYHGDTIVLTGTSAGGLGTYEWANYVHSKTVTAKVYAMPDSGIFMTNYYSPIAKEKVIGQRVKNLLSIVMSQSSLQLPDPVQKCLKTEQFKNDYVSCFDASNFGQFLTPPTLILQSPYDKYCLDNILIVGCAKGTRAPYSLNDCNQTTRAAIDDFRNAMVKAMKKMKSPTINTGVIGGWGPACVQHCFLASSNEHSNNYRVPTITGKTIDDMISIFLRDETQVPWLIQEIPWPQNTGCSGEATSHLRENVFEQ